MLMEDSLNALKKCKVELQLRHYSERTIKAYMYHNKRFLSYLDKDSSLVDLDDIKAYLAHLMADLKLKPSTVSLVYSSLKFFYDLVLKKGFFHDIPAPKQIKTVPYVVSRADIKRMIDVLRNSKHRLFLELLYSSGLRVSECVRIKKSDIDLDEKIGYVRSGKGKKDRIIILSNRFISHFVSYTKLDRSGSDYLFSSGNTHISTRNAQKIVSKAAKRAGIEKRVYCHALRSSFATHLMEDGVNVRIIQELLGHSNLNTTQRYTNVSRAEIKKIKSPLD